MNLPNQLTIGRVVAVPFFIVIYLMGYETVAAILFILASATDARIARERASQRISTSLMAKTAPWSWRVHDEIFIRTPFSTAGMKLRGIAPPTIATRPPRPTPTVARRCWSCALEKNWRPCWARTRPDGHDPAGIAGGGNPGIDG